MKKRANRLAGVNSRPQSNNLLKVRKPSTSDADAIRANATNHGSADGLSQLVVEPRIGGRYAGRGTPLRYSRAVDKFRTIRHVSELLLVCDRTLFRWIDRKRLLAHQFGGATRVAEHDLCDFIVRARRAGAPLVHPCDDCFYTAADVAGILNVCLRTVRRHIEADVLIAHDLDGIIRISESDLRDYCERSRRK